MPASEDVNLDNPEGLTQEDLDILKRQAGELAVLAEDAEKNADKINKSKKSMEGLNFAQLNLLSEGPTDAEIESGAPLDQAGLTDMVVDILKKMKEAEKERKENKADIDEARKQMMEFQQTSGNVKGVYGEIMNFRSNPFGFAKGKAMGFLGKAGIYGAVAQFAIQMGEQIYNQVLGEVVAQFRAGGAWDKRKLVQDELKEFNSINYLTRVKSGGVFFTADAGQDLVQGAPRGANNTRDLRDGHVRFLQFHYNE